MKFITVLMVLAASIAPYYVWGDASAEADPAASAEDGEATSVAPSLPPPPPPQTIICQCPNIYAPVCGSDGKTYSNECILDCVSTNNVNNGLPAINFNGRGECRRFPCDCKNIRDPVCGSDGHTYLNECYVKCENARRKLLLLRPITILYPGPCKQNVCICPNTIIPVCGTDGKTYKNICVLQCASRNAVALGLPPIYWASSGACKVEKCDCPFPYRPVCGDDGRTYRNQCELDCWNRRRRQLGLRPITVQYNGVCVNCGCPNVRDPVCASNGITYPNNCILACVNDKRGEQNLPLLTSCYCTRWSNWVCASDKKSYRNPCFLNCENTRRGNLGLPLIYILYNGRCK